MNLRAIAGPITAVVSGAVIGTWRKSTGYTTDATGSRTPTYADTAGLTLNVQALSGSELALLDGMNIQGIKRAVYMNGDVEGVDRKSGTGGDLLVFGGFTWLVVTVLETWDGSGWCKVAVTRQLDA